MRKPKNHAKAWTSEDDLLLIENVHRLSCNNHRKLFPGRTLGAVRIRVYHLGLAGQGPTHNGLSYTSRQVADAVGVGLGVVYRWIRLGMLHGVEEREPLCAKPGELKPNRPMKYQIPHPSVDDFITEYPMLFSLPSFPPTPLWGPCNHRQTLIEARPDRWVTCHEAARLLRCDESTIRKQARKHRLVGRKVLGSWYFRKFDLESARVEGLWRTRHDKAA
jgi:hypothetical protein